MNALTILQKYYGYRSFRTGQQELIDHILQGTDTIGILPTGGGKSLCYQIPALLLEGITLVISPLISLMKDQVDTLKEYGIQAELINSSLSHTEFREVIQNAKQGAYKLLYIAPERLETDSFIELMELLPVSLVAVDEAHCVSQWGHDFRPSYRRIAKMIQLLPKRPIVAAFTATATEMVKEDIINLLNLKKPFEFIGSFDRPNLYFEVRKPKSKFEDLKTYITESAGQSGIIYCATRKTVDEVCGKLNAAGVPATKYHAGLGEGERSENQEEFLYDRAPIMVATNAFGMGIDKPNVRFVVHYNMPKNMESYYQEAGRAGRDGEEAKCILLFSTQDIMTNRFLIENGGFGIDHSAEYQKLNGMVDYCNTEGCLRSAILTYFGQEAIDGGCDNCGSCNNETEQTDITIEAQKIMSCTKRMNEQFGSTLVTDVLKGANTQKIRDMRFNLLPTYGIMKDYSKETIKEIISFLIAGGYLALVGDQYPILRLTLKSYEVLKGQQKVAIRRILTPEQPVVHAETSIKQDLFNRLRQVRAQIAKEHQVQPFMIFPDTTLKDMCKKYPSNKEKMLQVTGVGEHKLEKYGDLFIEAIVSYMSENNILEQDIESLEQEISKASKQTTKTGSKDSHKQTYTLYKEGMNISEIAKERNLTPMTVENHLLKCFEEGLDLDYGEFIPAPYEEQIAAAIEKCGTELLKPIKEALPEEVSYTAIKFALCKYKYNGL
ncbi:DNA helicase RecQ [Cellulosilyticum sp. I15G10I2]|uniref:DNA helicase RecQ n=1 Tax=Cellulosilyticum sp. I15G10I2 TaxID=1892843 RepID=UPI00085C05B8|nr:DNA helicase RecQ [Cellulosilyticum sp. I15G10I2]